MNSDIFALAKQYPNIRNLIAECQIFSIPDALIDIAWNGLGSLMAIPEADLGFNWDLPAPSVLFFVGTAFYIITESESGSVTFLQADGEKKIFHALGTYRRSFDFRAGFVSFDGSHRESMSEADRFNTKIVCNAKTLDVLCSLIAEPRLVATTDAPRQQKRRAQKMLGGVLPAVWKDVRWNIGAAHRPNVLGDGKDYSTMPLHFSRAHWSYVNSDTDNSVWRFGSRGWGWYSWKKHSWKGDPRNGINLHRYIPDVGPDSPAHLTEIAAANAVSQWEAQNARKTARR